MDIQCGYNNVRIRKATSGRLCSTPLFEPTVMFFGLCNSPATFQVFMNEIFVELIREGSVKVYMDDILVSMDTMEEH
jgi:hypothetical protein